MTMTMAYNVSQLGIQLRINDTQLKQRIFVSSSISIAY